MVANFYIMRQEMFLGVEKKVLLIYVPNDITTFKETKRWPCIHLHF